MGLRPFNLFRMVLLLWYLWNNIREMELHGYLIPGASSRLRVLLDLGRFGILGGWSSWIRWGNPHCTPLSAGSFCFSLYGHLLTLSLDSVSYLCLTAFPTHLLPLYLNALSLCQNWTSWLRGSLTGSAQIFEAGHLIGALAPSPTSWAMCREKAGDLVSA